MPDKGANDSHLLFAILDSRSQTVQARMVIYKGKDMSEAARCLGARWIVILLY